MRLRIILFFVLLSLAVLQTTLVPSFLVLLADNLFLKMIRGHTIDLMLLSLIYLSFRRSVGSSIVWASIATVIIQSLGTSWKGSIHLSFFAMVIIIAIVKRGIIAKSFYQKWAIVFTLSLVNAWVQIYFGGTFERFTSPFSGMISFVLVQAMLDALMAHGMFKFLYTIEKAFNKRIRKQENIFFNTELGYGFTSF